jgi:putative transposase
MKEEYNRKDHCKYLLKLHFVFAVKYRKKLLVKNIDIDMKQILFETAQLKGFKIDTIQSDVDHIHILIDTSPTFSPFEIAHQLKQISTFRIWKKYSLELRKQFWKEKTFWSDGYFVCSTGNASTETIQNYIENQG